MKFSVGFKIRMYERPDDWTVADNEDAFWHVQPSFGGDGQYAGDTKAVARTIAYVRKTEAAIPESLYKGQKGGI